MFSVYSYLTKLKNMLNLCYQKSFNNQFSNTTLPSFPCPGSCTVLLQPGGKF